MSLRLRIPDKSAPLQLSLGGVRWGMFLLGLGLLSVLGVARFLQPDPRGLGTHEQLGLAPCGFLLLFGVPCPSCGMTTAWSLFTRGEIVLACRVNMGGVALALSTLMAAGWLVISALRGRWLFGWPTPLAWALGTGLLGVVIVTSWLVKLIA